jgi:hypothetical protein
MNMEQMQQFKSMRQEIEALKLRVTDLEKKAEHKKRGPKPKRQVNAV